MAGGEMLVLREEVAKLLKALPAVDAHALHALGDRLDRGDRGLLDVFVGAIRDWLSGGLDALVNDPRGLVCSAEHWDRLNASARDVAIYNLERKPMVFAIFGLLAEASGG
jgi:DNA polymerase III subunit delta'